MERRLLVWMVGMIFSLCLTSQSYAVTMEQNESMNGLQAVLSIPKNKVSQDEDVKFELELRNVSNAPLSLCRYVDTTRWTTAYVEFLVQREGDKTPIEIAQWVDDHVLPPPGHFVQIKPGDSLKFSLSMEPKYNQRSNTLEPGRYQLSLRVIFSDEGRQVGVKDAWAGTVISNSVPFEIAGGSNK